MIVSLTVFGLRMSFKVMKFTNAEIITGPLLPLINKFIKKIKFN